MEYIEITCTFIITGEQIKIKISKESIILDLINEIRKKEKIKLNIMITIINKEMITKEINEEIEEEEYSILLSDELKNIKEHLRNDEEIYLNFDDIDQISYKIDEELLRLLIEENKLQYLVTELLNNDLMIIDISKNIIKNRKLEMIKILINLKCEIPKNACMYAVENEDINVIKYLHEELKYILNEKTYEAAVYYNRKEIIEYLEEKRCKYSVDIYIAAVNTKNLEIIKYFDEKGYKKKIHWGGIICKYAALYGMIEILKYCHENGYIWGRRTCKSAARNKQIECLKYAYKNGCPCPESIIRRYNLDEKETMNIL